MKLIKIIFLFLASAFVCEGYKVLLMFPFPGRSHNILGQGIARHLTAAGHQVTYVTVYPQKDTPLMRYVDVSANALLIPENVTDIRREMDHQKVIGGPNDFINLVRQLCVTTLQNENVHKLLNDPKEQFDVVIAEWMFHELYSGVATVYECPFIWVSTVEPHWAVLSLIDQATNPAYVPNAISSNAPPFGFQERVKELLMQSFAYFFKQVYTFSIDEEYHKSIFGPILQKRGIPLPSYEDVMYNVSLILGNSHVSLGQATSLPQSYKPVAGWHVDPDVKPLPEDLKKIMDGAKDGVIYFSMGSNIRSKDLPAEVKRDLLQMFSGLKQTVLWKFEEEMANRPNNVHILKWAPQQAILTHPNTRLFITHGGLLSTIETLYYGVPIIGIPVFADQFINIDRAVQKGFARRVDLSYQLAEPLRTAIQEVIHNPKYSAKAKELSAIYHDRPVPPGAELVHWVQHVVRTRGAPHLRSPALRVPWYQKLFLDLLVLVLLVLLLVKIAIKTICKLVCSKKSTQRHKKKNN